MITLHVRPRFKWIVLSFLSFAVGVVLYYHYLWARERDAILKSVDDRLVATADLVPLLLSRDFHDRAVGPDSIPLSEELLNRRQINEFVAIQGVRYAQTLVRYEGKFYLSAPTVSRKEARERGSWYFCPYEGIPEFLNEIYETGRSDFLNYRDGWGEHRSLCKRFHSPAGVPYLVLVDIGMRTVRSLLSQALSRLLLSALSILLIVSPLGCVLLLLSADLQDSNAKLRAANLNGERSLARFLAAPTPVPIAESEKPAAYARLAQQAANGDLPGSPAGGEQPKFTAYAMTEAGAQHVIVKFSEAEAGPVGERWRDLLLAEFLALTSLRNAGMAAAHAHVVDNLNTPARQRFLEIRRFDRFGARGRLGLHSLTALDLEFVGKGNAGWPEITRELARQGRIDADSAHQAARLWAFGHLIGNTDMHGGNLSFLSHTDRPYTLAPAYDMTPMAFAPRSGGGLPEALPPAVIRADIAPECWHRALAMAQTFLRALGAESRFSPRFAPCIAALGEHIETAARQIGRLAG